MPKWNLDYNKGIVIQNNVRITPPPNWRALQIQKAAKDQTLGGRKAAFKQRYRREE